ncbi:MAG: hemolysin family protein [Geminicoccaceae bacterium]|nr:hemolysin family protein [Geminicoccaceae bacterium]
MAAFISSRKAKLQQRADDGNVGAKAALELLASPSRLLSTVQVGITLIGIVAGAYGGTTLAGSLAPGIARIPALAPYAQEIAFTIIVLLITYLQLVIGELVPKRLALRSPERIAALMAFPMQVLSTVAKPLVWLLTVSTDSVLRLFGQRGSHEPPVTDEEIQVLMDEGTRAGVFEEAEQETVRSILSLGDRQVDSLMTPRPDIVWLDLEDPIEETRRKILESPHGRFPVAEGSLDKVIGVVRARDLVVKPNFTVEDLRSLAQPPLFVPATLTAWQLLEMFKQKRTHMALVVDEYGGLQGVVTLHDILEAIVGDLPSNEEAEDEPWIVRRDDGSYLLDGALPIEEFKELFDIE